MNLDDWLIQNENLTVEEINEILRGKKATYSDGEEFIIKEFNEVGDYQVEWFDIKENTFRLYEEIQEVQ